jgi:hypothetical protein
MTPLVDRTCKTKGLTPAGLPSAAVTVTTVVLASDCTLTIVTGPDSTRAAAFGTLEVGFLARGRAASMDDS